MIARRVLGGDGTEPSVLRSPPGRTRGAARSRERAVEALAEVRGGVEDGYDHAHAGRRPPSAWRSRAGENRLAAVERLGVACPRLHATEARRGTEGVGGDQGGPAATGRRPGSTAPWRRRARPEAARTRSAPRSPGRTGTWYSRTRWSRNVFQVELGDEAMVLVGVVAVVGEHQVWRTRGLEGLEGVLHAPSLVGEDSRRGSPRWSPSARRPRRGSGPRPPRPRASAHRSRSARPGRRRGAGTCRASSSIVPPQPISMSSACAPSRSTRSGSVDARPRRTPSIGSGRGSGGHGVGPGG